MSIWRPTIAEVDLSAIRENCRALGAALDPGTERLAVVKANGYGHGDVEVSRACLETGVSRLGVALVEEGVRLREAGIDVPIVLLIEAPPDAAKEIVVHELTPSVFTPSGAAVLSEAAVAAGRSLLVHVCVDTGMHREGAPLEGAADFVAHVAQLPGLEVEGLWSHLAVADERGNPETGRQIERFAHVCEEVARRGVALEVRHLANSATTIAHPEAQFDMVRMGISVYGLYPGAWLREHCPLRPAMRLSSRVGMVRRVAAGEGVSYGHEFVAAHDTTIANVQIGYGDGYPRLLSNRAPTLVGGRRRIVAGRVTMDTTMIDCGDDDVGIGDEVVLIGRQGTEEVTAGELADLIGTIHYEIVCGLTARIPRVYR